MVTEKIKVVWCMNKIMKGYIFRLYPDDNQIKLIEKREAKNRKNII